MCRNGAEVRFDAAGGYVLRNGHRQALRRRGSLQFMPVKLLDEHQSNVEEIEARPWMLYEWACEGNSRLARWFILAGYGAARLHLPEHDLRQRSCTTRL
eukprot:11693808-Heterocapsa_arctica.AAC.1